MKFNAEKNMFNAGDKVVVRKWDDVVDDVKYNDNDPLSIERRLECAHLYGGKVAVVVEWGNDVYGGEDKVALVPIYRLADESGNIIPFAFKNCMLARWESNDAKEEAKQSDGAAEEKFAGRPQIQKGDIVRFIAGETGKEVVEVVTCEIEEGASYTPAFSFNPFFNEVVAIYRFDGRDFKCIWESREYKRLKLNEVLARAAAGAEHMEENVKSIIAALEQIGRYAKETGDGEHGSEKAN